MGKLPAFQFYPNDWSRDLEEHPLEIEGAWIRICCKLWWSDTRGELTRTYDQWGRILGVSATDAERILTYLGSYRICDISVTCHGNVTPNVTVRSRRMFRDDIDRRQAAERQRRRREKMSCHADVTDASSYSSSYSSTKHKKEKTILAQRQESKNGKKANYNFDTHAWENISDSFLVILSKAYPAVDVQSELNAMAAWLEANPKNKKSDYPRFINNWLKRAQDQAPRSGGEIDYLEGFRDK
jgi:hypothetical protein